MRTYHSALVALQAVFYLPFRYVDSYATFFIGSRPLREGTVFQAEECADRQAVPFLSIDRFLQFRDEFRYVFLCFRCIGRIGPGCRDIDLHDLRYALVDGGVVHINDFLAFLAIVRDDSVFQIFHGIFNGDDIGQFEERRLHDHVKPATQSDILGNLDGIDRVELDMFLCQGPFHRSRQVLFQSGCIPDGVQQERAAVFDTGQYVVFVYVGLLRARYEVGFIDQIGRRNRRLAKAQVGYGDTAGFLGIIGKICLGIHVRMVADDLDSRLVGADRTITTEAPEFAGRRASRCRIDILGDRQGRIGYVVGNGNGEMIFRRILFQVFEDAEDMGRCRILAAEAGTAAYDERCVFYAAVGLGDIEIERFYQGALFLCAVQDGDFPNRFRDIFEEIFK